ncbi:hypothetical protein PM10SUCC1_38850 [Propionigenium maris DSM 9537]|uniref:Uncharacterized protein n=1 Tax=Propionigenium maris DSM 9537 TaxID=1123000 RepID=A0A9W6GQE9_9FUSO|nr:hypothetical protein PM10SUCC1_38850 [Propionigenium maris DSM 9537]
MVVLFCQRSFDKNHHLFLGLKKYNISNTVKGEEKFNGLIAYIFYLVKDQLLTAAD